MRSGSSTTCGCRISWAGTYYWGIPRRCWLPCGISQYCNPRTSWMVWTQLRPYSVAAILPSMRSMAQAFHHGKEINRAEALAALLGLSWAAGDELLDSHITLWTDNAAVFNTLREGGHLWRFHDLRRLYLSVMHRLRASSKFCLNMILSFTSITGAYVPRPSATWWQPFVKAVLASPLPG